MTYITIVDWCREKGVDPTHAKEMGSYASKHCKRNYIDIGKLPVQGMPFPHVNKYPKYVLDNLFHKLIPRTEEDMPTNRIERDQPSALEELITDWSDDVETQTENKRHRHADVIHAWAEGEKIQYEHRGNWCDIDEPDWYEDANYRIKPKLVKHDGWINIYRDDHMNVSPEYFYTKDAADKFSEGRVACIHVEWEEEV